MRTMLTFTMTPTDDGKFIDKVKSIKGLRQLTGLSLKDSKNFVEEVQDKKSLTIEMNIVNSGKEQTEAFSLLKAGGISVINNDKESRTVLINEIKETATRALTAEQYDIVRSLVNILETTK